MGSQRTPSRLGLPAAVAARVDDLLARLDRAVPGRIEGFYVVGSVCLGAFRYGRSDIDFVAVVDGGLDRGELRRLRAIHRGRWIDALIRDVGLAQRWPLVCNGSYLRRGDLSRSPLGLTPLAGHVAGRFRGDFDVNPVTWHTLARHGIAVRGPDPSRLEIRVDAAELRAWTRANLDDYWRGWERRARRPGPISLRAFPRRFAASGVLGVSRLHYTLATGEVAGKEVAGEYALAAFDAGWSPIIEDALAFWRGAPAPVAYRRRPRRRVRAAAEFVAHVIDCARPVR